MSFFIRVHGVPVECATVQEARELLNAYGELLRVPPARELAPTTTSVTYRGPSRFQKVVCGGRLRVRRSPRS